MKHNMRHRLYVYTYLAETYLIWSGVNMLKNWFFYFVSSYSSTDILRYCIFLKFDPIYPALPFWNGIWRHNDLPWNLRKFLHGQLQEFDFNSDLKSTPPWSKSAWSHTDLPRLRRGLVGAQVFPHFHSRPDSRSNPSIKLDYSPIFIGSHSNPPPLPHLIQYRTKDRAGHKS